MADDFIVDNPSEFSIELAKTLLGEHFEHYVIIVAPEPHMMRIEYNNTFAAKGLIHLGSKYVDSFFKNDLDNTHIEFVDEEESDDSSDSDLV